MSEKAIQAALDPTTMVGTGASGIGFAATFAQYYPMITGSMAFIVMVMTIIHLYRRISNGSLDSEIKLQTIELNKRELLRKDTDHNPTED